MLETIKTVDVRRKTFENLIILLGFFDCLHIGHQALLRLALKEAEKKNAKVAMLTFNDGFEKTLGYTGNVLTLKERAEKAERLGVNIILTVDFDEEFKNLSPDGFIKLLTDNHSVSGFACGYDFTYGKDASGNVETLKKTCDAQGVSLFVLPKQEADDKKIATSLVKEYLTEGDMQSANKLLGEPYYLIGKVVEGRKVGRKMGFPTANIEIPSGKMPIRRGVYKTHAEIDGKIYKGITNYGARPTFYLDEILTETYFAEFTGDLYGKELCLYFDGFLRTIQKFSSEEELVKRLTEDLGGI